MREGISYLSYLVFLGHLKEKIRELDKAGGIGTYLEVDLLGLPLHSPS